MARPTLTPPSDAFQPRPATIQSGGGGAVIHQSPGSDDLAQAMETQRLRLQQAIDRLPEPNRAAILLTFFEGHDAQSVAHALGMPLLTAQGVTVDGLRRLRALLL